MRFGMVAVLVALAMVHASPAVKADEKKLTDIDLAMILGEAIGSLRTGEKQAKQEDTPKAKMLKLQTGFNSAHDVLSKAAPRVAKSPKLNKKLVLQFKLLKLGVTMTVKATTRVPEDHRLTVFEDCFNYLSENKFFKQE